MSGLMRSWQLGVTVRVEGERPGAAARAQLAGTDSLRDDSELLRCERLTGTSG